MLASLYSASVAGVQAFPVEVEVYVGYGFGKHPVVVGLPDAAVKESCDRVKAALETSGFRFPDGRLTINLAPADVRKEGPLFDLPIALGLLSASDQANFQNLRDYIVVGELALKGALRPVKGILPMALWALKTKKRGLIVPKANAPEAAVVQGLDVFPADNLREVVAFLEGEALIAPFQSQAFSQKTRDAEFEVDFADVKGQESVKRGLEVAVAGGHNVLMIGPPGSGKSMLAKRLPTIMPQMTFEEALETTKVHSVIGGLLENGHALLKERPFRSPHHTISDIGLIGGSMNLTPGEVSLSHNGVLFLDELPEFKRGALEVLRQPLEDGQVTISRASGSLTFPARFMFVGAMNPTPTGNAEDVRRGKVSSSATQRYLNKISGPLLDRIDLHLEVAELKHDVLMKSPNGESSSDIRQRVETARRIQHTRFASSKRIWCNAQMGSKEIRKYVELDEGCQCLLEWAMKDLQLSARAYDRILKVARTIADLAGEEKVNENHVSEAVGYRSLDRQYWG